jgi:hypothetical protein
MLSFLDSSFALVQDEIGDITSLKLPSVAILIRGLQPITGRVRVKWGRILGLPLRIRIAALPIHPYQ